ncbi:MAG: endonuclease/exonuclease/phosphatase family protein [Planctomycetes bacterium]|nr:endonuclease/exonuclease/phosphatase family protein [Planctomycetota bacterium]
MRFAAQAFLFLSCLTISIVRAEDPPVVSGPGMIEWKNAGQFIGREVIVQGWIVQTRDIGNMTFLNFDRERTVTAIIRKRNYKNFSTPPDRLYSGKFVRIQGIVSEYRGKPQLEIFKPEQVTVLEKEEPIPAGREAKATAPLPLPKKREFNGIVKIACYNVENLFDEFDDPYKQDESTEAKPDAQLELLAQAIRSIDADVIAFEEVENRGVLERFLRTRLSDLGYSNVVHFEGNDSRGIDCSVATWLPVGPVTSHRHVAFSDGSGGQTTFRRDLIQVRIQPPETTAFDVFVVHLKCCGGEDDIRIRRAEAGGVRQIIDGLLKDDPEARFVICGDFNDRWDSPAMKTIRGEGATELRGFLADLPEGAVSYHKPPHLSIIDFVVASPAMAKTYVPKSYQIVAGEPQKRASDHFPVSVAFDLGKSTGKAAQNENQTKD